MTYWKERESAESGTEPLGPLEYKLRSRTLLGSLDAARNTQRLQRNAEKSTMDPLA